MTTEDISASTEERVAFLIEKGVEESVIASVSKNVMLPATEAAPVVAAPTDGLCRKSELCDNVHNHRGLCNKRKRPVVANA